MSTENSTASKADIEQMSAWNWHGTSYAPPAVDALIHEQIQEHVKHQPDAEAVCAWDGSLSYSDLDVLSSLVANYLQENYHVGPETFVPLCFEKSKWNVVSMLAILKAGGAFVPMDPEHPAQRKQTIISLLGDQFAGVVLTSAKLMKRLAELEQPLLKVDESLPPLASYCKPIKNQNLTPSTAALVIFTSGSTGTPKGIVAEHRGYCSSAAYHGPAMAVDKDSRVFQFAAHTFDVSLRDILTTLIHGGCVCIPSDDQRVNDVEGAIQTLKSNHLSLTPTVACIVDPTKVLPAVKRITLGGEALSQQVLKIWADKANVIQGYGPAEAGVDCTMRQHVQPNDPPGNLGRAVGSSIWIVDPNDHDKLVPIGAEGELLIEGPIVARGYLANETQTNKSFIWDPKWVQLTKVRSGRRFYKTGDLGRYGKDGEIHIVGRNDSQVKIRGQRLEIGEVEYQLAAAVGQGAKICAAAVTPKDGDKMLAAFVDAGDDDMDNDDDSLVVASTRKLAEFRVTMELVKQQMQENLPPYMVPSVFIPLRKLPLSTSGKIERKRLCEFAENLSTQELTEFTSIVDMNREIIAPSTPKERVLCKAWEDVLQLKDVGAGDNFFHLGGDSAKAMLLVSELRKSGFSLWVADIINNPILSQQAITLVEKVDLAAVAPFSIISASVEDRDRIRKNAASACGVDIGQILDVYPVTEMQERFFSGAYLGTPGNTWVQEAQELHDHARQTVFKMPKGVNVRRLMDAWRVVVQRHGILRTRFVRDTDHGVLQVIVEGDVPVATHDSSLDDFIQKDRTDRMHWGCPLVRVAAGECATWFVLTISHAIYDGMSLKMVFDEVKRAYHQEFQVPPSIHMSHFIKQLSGGDRDAAVEFWRKEFVGVDVKPIVPHALLDRRTVSNVVRRTTIKLSGTLPPSANRAVMVQVTAALFLAHNLGCGDIIFDCHQSGRTGKLPGVGDLVGPTLLSLPTRVHIGNQSNNVQDILRRTQDHLLKVVEHEHVGWWTLVQMHEFRNLLHGAPLLNILPGGEATGSQLGLENQGTIAHNEAPYCVMGTLVDANTIELLITSDGDCVSKEEVEKQLEQWELVLRRVWDSRVQGGADNLTVGDISDLLSGTS